MDIPVHACYHSVFQRDVESDTDVFVYHHPISRRVTYFWPIHFVHRVAHKATEVLCRTLSPGWEHSPDFIHDLSIIFYECDIDKNCCLRWNSGEIRTFLHTVCDRRHLPRLEERVMYDMYRAFDHDSSHSLDFAEAQHLAHAMVNTLLAATECADHANQGRRNINSSEIYMAPAFDEVQTGDDVQDNFREDTVAVAVEWRISSGGIPTEFKGISDMHTFDDIPQASFPRHETHNKYASDHSIVNAMNFGHTILLRGSWIVEKCSRKEKFVLSRRQDMPADAYWRPGELRTSTAAGHLLDDEGLVKVVAISYCWWTPEHPDPDGEQLMTIAAVLKSFLEAGTVGNCAVFIDFCSLFQKPHATLQEKTSFKCGLGDVNLWYAHPSTMVVRLTHVPRNVRKYAVRGWPVFEKLTSEMNNRRGEVILVQETMCECDWDQLLGTGVALRDPPTTPQTFSKMVQKLVFTNGADRDLVVRKYEETYMDVMACLEDLKLSDVGWDDDDVTYLAKALQDMSSLKEIQLNMNLFGDRGAQEIALSLWDGPPVRVLGLQANNIADMGVTYLSRSLPHMPYLRELHLTMNHVGDAGAVAIADALPLAGCGLQQLCLGCNQIGNEGAFAFIRALESGVSLRTLALNKNRIECTTQLSESWAQHGKESTQLNVARQHVAVDETDSQKFVHHMSHVAHVQREIANGEAREVNEQERCGGPVVKRVRGRPGSATIDPQEHTVTFNRFSSVGAPQMLAKSGVLYFEVEVLDIDGMSQVGFASESFILASEETIEGVGDDMESWAVDGTNCCALHDVAKDWTCNWVVGDVVGLAANVDVGKIAVSKNGCWLDEEGVGVVFHSLSICKGVYPAFYGLGQKLRFNLDGNVHGPFKHEAPMAELWTCDAQRLTTAWWRILARARDLHARAEKEDGGGPSDALSRALTSRSVLPAALVRN